MVLDFGLTFNSTLFDTSEATGEGIGSGIISTTIFRDSGIGDYLSNSYGTETSMPHNTQTTAEVTSITINPRSDASALIGFRIKFDYKVDGGDATRKAHFNLNVTGDNLGTKNLTFQAAGSTFAGFTSSNYAGLLSSLTSTIETAYQTVEIYVPFFAINNPQYTLEPIAWTTGGAAGTGKIRNLEIDAFMI